MENIEQPAEATVEVVDIQFRPGQKIYYFAPNGVQCRPGDHLIIDTSRGPEFGYCTGGNHKIRSSEIVSPLRPVLRKATAQDEQTAEKNREREKKAYEVCLEKVRELQLDMQLVSAECAFDGSKILVFFTADERVDFRDLVKNMAAVFHTRIELRQIGVRDKAKMVGGLGICGRAFCCSCFMEDFQQPVSIKMAKTQNLSLNPTKISGTCGRLMCCLKYEQEAYEDLIRNSPKVESFVDTPEGRGTVTELDLLRQRVKVRLEDRPEVLMSFKNDEIAVLRNGKAKKNDPPIPADLAPISGSGRRKKQEEPESGRLFLDSIKLRYSTETIAEEQPVEPEKPEEPAKPAKNRNRRKPKKQEQQKPAAEPKEQKTEEKPKEQKTEEKPAGEQPKKHRPNHRRRYHHHKSKAE